MWVWSGIGTKVPVSTLIPVCFSGQLVVPITVSILWVFTLLVMGNFYGYPLKMSPIIIPNGTNDITTKRKFKDVLKPYTTQIQNH